MLGSKPPALDSNNASTAALHYKYYVQQESELQSLLMNCIKMQLKLILDQDILLTLKLTSSLSTWLF